MNKGLCLKAVTTATATKASETIREVFSVNSWLFTIYAGEPAGKWFAKFRTGKFRPGIAFTICTNQFHLP